MRKNRGDVNSSIDFTVNAFEGVAGAQADLMGRRQGKALRQVFFHPRSEFWSGFGRGGNEFFEASVGGQEIKGLAKIGLTDREIDPSVGEEAQHLGRISRMDRKIEGSKQLSLREFQAFKFSDPQLDFSKTTTLPRRYK